MAQPSVAREPSMEEILASIRRIIESNDPVGEGQALSRPQASPFPDTSSFEDDEDSIDISDEMDASFVPQRAANDPGLPFSQSYSEPAPLRPTLDAATRQRFAAEAQSAVTSTPPAPAPQPERSLSLADVAARVRAAAGRVPEPISARAAQAVSEARPVTELRPARDEAPQAVETAPLPVEEAPPVQRMAEVSEVEAKEEPVSLPARIEDAAHRMLLSEEAGAQVTRSFNELADIFNGLERQSVEDMARDLLQPMLREWLEDNLPTLVERLVREEIERVARGPRR